MVNIVFSRPY